MSNVSYKKGLSLAALSDAIASDEQGLGKLTELGRTAVKTVATYEDGPAPMKLIELRLLGGGDAPPGYTLVCKGKVWIVGQPQDVIAVRPT